jgi:hypothetical protein
MVNGLSLDLKHKFFLFIYLIEIIFVDRMRRLNPKKLKFLAENDLVGQNAKI